MTASDEPTPAPAPRLCVNCIDIISGLRPDEAPTTIFCDCLSPLGIYRLTVWPKNAGVEQERADDETEEVR
jgi:hypothetical protein